MAINKPFSATEDEKTYVFPETQKEDFVLRAVEARTNCFQGYDEGFVQELFNKQFESQSDFDMVADKLLDVGVEYYFGQQYSEHNVTYVEDAIGTLKAMIDGFVYSFNEYKEKLLEHANELADNVVLEMLDGIKKNEAQKTLKTITSRIPDCIVDETRKKQAELYFATQKPDTSNIFIAPDYFASQCTFATLQEQAVISHMILAEFQKLAFLIESAKRGLRDVVDPIQVDSDLFVRINILHKMVLDWRKKAYTHLQTKVVNRVYAHYVATCLIISQDSKLRS